MPVAAMSAAAARPEPVAKPADADADADAAAAAAATADFPLPKLRLEVRDLNHAGARLFLDAVNATACLGAGLGALLRLLYGSPASPTTTVPPTRSVTLILRDMPGVAYTTGSELDADHKEVHLSLGYVAGLARPAAARPELAGVVTHELVHCFQYDGRGTCPSGLIEGVADWVRLRCGLAPPHWAPDASGRWDAGYHVTAYFLDYLEGRVGPGLVRRLNEKLRVARYDGAVFWPELTGHSVGYLWAEYGAWLAGESSRLAGESSRLASESSKLADESRKLADESSNPAAESSNPADAADAAC